MRIFLIALASLFLMSTAYAVDVEQARSYAAKGEYDKAYKIWQAGAEADDALSQYYLGVMYEKGNGVTQDYPQALFWYIKAANKNVPRAHYNVGNMFFNGRGVTVDYKEAARRYKLAADLNYAPAQLNLGYIYEQGLLEQKKSDETFQWYSKAANNGLEKAQLKVAKYYAQNIEGQGTLDAAKRKRQAIFWFQKALAQNPESAARYDLAMLYLQDKKTEKEGVQLLRGAAEADDPMAQYQLGYLYGQGTSLKQDYEQATFWYKRAAKQQVPEAQFVLCLSYSLGKGVPVDIVLAHVWCEAAVENKVDGAEDAFQAIRESMSQKQLNAAVKVAPVLLSR